MPLNDREVILMEMNALRALLAKIEKRLSAIETAISKKEEKLTDVVPTEVLA